MADLHSFLQSVKKLVDRKNGSGLSRLLSLPLSSDVPVTATELAKRAGELNVQTYCSTNLRLAIDIDLASVVGYYLSALSALCKGDYVTTIEQYTVSAFVIYTFMVNLHNVNIDFPFSVRIKLHRSALKVKVKCLGSDPFLFAFQRIFECSLCR